MRMTQALVSSPNLPSCNCCTVSHWPQPNTTWMLLKLRLSVKVLMLCHCVCVYVCVTVCVSVRVLVCVCTPCVSVSLVLNPWPLSVCMSSFVVPLIFGLVCVCCLGICLHKCFSFNFFYVAFEFVFVYLLNLCVVLCFALDYNNLRPSHKHICIYYYLLWFFLLIFALCWLTFYDPRLVHMDTEIWSHKLA